MQWAVNAATMIGSCFLRAVTAGGRRGRPADLAASQQAEEVEALLLGGPGGPPGGSPGRLLPGSGADIAGPAR